MFRVVLINNLVYLGFNLSYLYNNLKYMDEEELYSAGFSKIAGIDEAGRGSLFAEVVVACVILHKEHGIVGLKDSKKLSEKKREELYDQIMNRSIAVSLAQASNKEIDNTNIYRAVKKCIYSSINNLVVQPDFVVVDGTFTLDKLLIPYLSIPGADGAEIYDTTGNRRKLLGHHYESVAAASVVAKVYRDRLMKEYAKIYTDYGLDKNKGYGTALHMEALRKYGPTDLHRKTFRGVL